MWPHVDIKSKWAKGSFSSLKQTTLSHHCLTELTLLEAALSPRESLFILHRGVSHGGEQLSGDLGTDTAAGTGGDDGAHVKTGWWLFRVSVGFFIFTC